MSEIIIEDKPLANKFFIQFLTIWIGDLISTIGSGLTAFALGVYAFKLTGLATSSALIVLFTFLPAFILRPVGGALADRINRTSLMMLGNIGSALGIGLIFLLMKINPNNLLMIYPGLIVSSIFFALQNPAYKASVSDFLPKELYAKASGLMQLSNAAQFLIAPALAGILMSVMNIRYVLLIDVSSFLIAALAVVIARNSGEIKKAIKQAEPFNLLQEIIDGFYTITTNRGVLILVFLVSLILFYIGLIQSLLTPLVLSFANASTLGISQSICAIGMLFSSIFISIVQRKLNNFSILVISLGAMGLFFSFIGISANIWSILIPGFLFFTAIPFVNSSIDVLIRQNISNTQQGRVWSLISVITYAGSIIAYAVAGVLADKIFNPLFMPGGVFANNLGHLFGIGPGRGIAFIFFISGIFVIILTGFIFKSSLIRGLETA